MAWRARLIDFGKQTEVPVRDLIYEYLNFVEDVVDELGSRQQINYIHRILEMGTGADRQLRVFRETGDLKKVVDYMIEETRAGLAEENASAGAEFRNDGRPEEHDISIPSYNSGRTTRSTCVFGCSLRNE